MLDRSAPLPSTAAMGAGIGSHDRLVSFLAHRQFMYLAKQESEGQDGGDDENLIESRLGDLSLEGGGAHVGFNGRWNKKADTCYCWWVGGTLAVRGPLGRPKLCLVTACADAD